MGSVPELRFPEFSGEWREVKLGEITSKIGSGKTPTGGDKVYTKQGIPFIRSQNIIDNKLVLDNTHITKNTHDTMRNSIVFANDILLNITGGSIGRSCVVPPTFIEGNVNQHVSIIRLIDDKPEFIQSILSSWRGQKLIFQNQTGSGREGLNFENIKSFKVHIPSLPEQQKIADFLSAVDEKITLSQEKITRLEAYKKGMMQKLLSGELRFPGFTDVWREVEIGEIFKERSERCKDCNLPLLAVTRAEGVVKRSEIERKDNSSQDKSNYKIVKENDIAYNSMRMWQGTSGVSNYTGIISPAYTVVYLDNDFISDYFGYLFKLPRVVFDFYRYSQGLTSDTWNLKYKQLSKIKLFITPNRDEQQKIADFLTAIDDKLTLEKERLEALKRYKQGLLQKMFV